MTMTEPMHIIYPPIVVRLPWRGSGEQLLWLATHNIIAKAECPVREAVQARAKWLAAKLVYQSKLQQQETAR
jgi:hypothetical protein